MDILDDMGVSKLSAKVFSKVNYSFNKPLKLLLIKKNDGFIISYLRIFLKMSNVFVLFFMLFISIYFYSCILCLIYITLNVL